jgi:putative ABC transport system permease protein
MFFKILKNDLRRKKTMNIILFIFIMIASMFMASGVNNLYQTLTALDYYAKKADMCDLVVFMNASTDIDKMEQLLTKNEHVTDYVRSDHVFGDKENIFMSENKEFEVDTTTFLTTMPDSYSKVFDDYGNAFTVNPGEVAVAKKVAARFGIEVGDTMTFQYDDYKKDYTVVALTKDYTYGSDFMGVARYIISSEDYEELMAREDVTVYTVYYVNSNNVSELQRDINNENISVMGLYPASIFLATYFMVMTLAGVVMLVSVAIILIAFLALRFSILFTLEHEYKQIGIMKAIGMRNLKIRLIYLTKYFGIALIGATVGLLFSFPFGNVLLKTVKESLLMQGGSRLFLVNILAAFATVAIVVLFSFACSRKLKKYSAIESIRSGSTGERYKAKQKVKLHTKVRLQSVTFLALNDIFSNLKKYIVLILTFAVGLMLMITPMNLVTTLSDESMIINIGMLKREFYYSPSNINKIMQSKSTQEVDQFLDSLEQKVRDHGVNITLSLDIMYSVSLYKGEKGNSTQIAAAIQNRYESTMEYEFYEGVAPVLANEIAITEITANEIDAKIGDTVTIKFADQEKDYLITGYYQNMNNLGQGVRFSQVEDINMSNIAGYYSLYGTCHDDSTNEQIKEVILSTDPEGTVFSTGEMLNDQMGSYIPMINQLSLIIFPVVSIMIAFITLLMVKSFIIKEKREIAMLKVLGFSNGKIKLWQVERIAFASCFGVVLGIALSRVFDMAGVAIFGLLGLSQFSLTVHPLTAYLLVPTVVVILNAGVSILGMSGLKKVNPMEVNNVE